MPIDHSYLRQHRKRSPLTQNDIAFIMHLSDFANVCRWEKGLRQPTIEAIIIYHLLFGFPIETLFETQKHELGKNTAERMKLLIAQLKVEKSTPKVKSRITFLESALTRLTA
ncbi:MAG: helix-turn-helix transcriptional regulator [Bacteroidetes bacterium]|nr:helix-turn-helix transcriptional regulator [Bacteroidota bacterium]